MQVERDEREARVFIRSYIRRQWCGTWCEMLRHNLFVCARDTCEGVRRPRFSANSARSGSYPPLEPAGPADDDDPPRRPNFNAVATVGTPAVVLSERLKGVGSRASAWGGIPTPARQSSRPDGGDRAATALFNGMSAVEGGSSGKGIMRPGSYSSTRRPLPSAALPDEAFDSADPNATIPRFIGMIGEDGGRPCDSGVTDRGVDSDGSYGNSDGVAPAAALESTCPDGAFSLNGADGVGGGSSCRRIIDQGLLSSWRSSDLDVGPLVETELSSIDGNNNDSTRSISAETMPALVSPGGDGVGLFRVGARGWGLMAETNPPESYGSGDSSPPPPPYKYFVEETPGPALECVARPEGAYFSSSSDLTSSAGGSTGKFSGRKVIRHGESKDYQYDNSTPSEGSKLDIDRFSRVFRAGDGGRSGKSTFGLPESRPPADSVFPKSRSFAGLGAAVAKAASFSLTTFSDSDSYRSDWKLEGEDIDGSSSGRHARGFPPLPLSARSSFPPLPLGARSSKQANSRSSESSC